MANTKGKGLILEVGEKVTLTTTGYETEEQEVWGVDYVPIYGDVYVGDEQVMTGGEWVITGYNTVTELGSAFTDWLYLSNESMPENRFLNDGLFFPENGFISLTTNTGDDCNIVGEFGPSFIGEYQMGKLVGKNSPNMARGGAIGTETCSGDGDLRESDQYSGLEIVGVETYGSHDFNTDNQTDSGMTYDFIFPDGNPMGEFGPMGWGFEQEQVFAFKCRQFSRFSNGIPSSRRECKFGTFQEGELGFPGCLQFTTGSGNYVQEVAMKNCIHDSGQIGATEWDGGWFEAINTNDNPIGGLESVQGRTLYLYPRSWVMPEQTSGGSVVTEFLDNVTNGSAYDSVISNGTIRWGDAPYNGVLTFDVLDGFNDTLYVKGSSKDNILSWIESLPGLAWPPGVEQTAEVFFSYYHGIVSHWCHSDGFRPDNIWNKAGDVVLDGDNPSGLVFNSQYLGNSYMPLYAPNSLHVGSYIKNLDDEKLVYPTYDKMGRLGWRCKNTFNGSNSTKAFSEDKGFQLYVSCSDFVNCKVQILTDVFTELEKDTITEFILDPGNGDLPPDMSGTAPYVIQTLTADNPVTNMTINGNNSIVAPRLYSPDNYLGSNNSVARQVMRSAVQSNQILGQSTTLNWVQDWLAFDWEYNPQYPYPETKTSFWEILQVTPIDKTQPYSVRINEIRMASAEFEVKTYEEEIVQYVPEFDYVPVYEWGETGEFDEVEVLEGYEDVITDQWEINADRYVWNYLDILKAGDNPVALNFNSGDLKDIKKRSAGYSKTFELPQNKHNQKILNSISNTSSDRPKKSIQWRPARIKSNGIIVFRGFARIEESVSGKGGTYKCHIIEDPTWWPNLIGDSKLCDLVIPIHYKTVVPYTVTETNPVTGEETTTTYPTIQQTWDMEYGDGGGLYNPDGDYLNNTSPGTGLGYVYPAINYGKWNIMDSSSVKSSKDFHPAYYVAYLVEEIFKSIGFRVRSNFFTSSTFRKLIIPYTSGEDYNSVDDMMGSDGTMMAKLKLVDFIHGVNCDNNNQGTEEIDTHGNKKRGAYLPRLKVVSDVSGLVNAVDEELNQSNCMPQGGYQVPFTGNYRMRYSTTVRWKNSLGNSRGCVAKWLIKRPDFSPSWRMIHKEYGQNAHTVSYNAYRFNSSLEGWCNTMSIEDDTDPEFNFQFQYVTGEPWGHTILWDQESGYPNPYGCGDCDICDCEGTNNYEEMDPVCGATYDDGQCWHPKAMECIIHLKQGDIINVGLFAWNTTTIGTKMWMDVKDQQLLIFPEPGGDDVPPSVVSPKRVLGCSMTQMGLLKGITEMFNLHWTADNEKKEVYCEPYDEFYGTGKIVDWTSKLDHSSWNDRFVIDDMAKEVNYKYKTDTGDSPIVQWEDENQPDSWMGKILREGDLYRKDIDIRGTDIFCSTMSINDRTFSNDWTNGDSFYMPCLWKGSEEDWLQHVDNDNSEFYTGGGGNLWETPRPDNSLSFNHRILNYYGTHPYSWFNLSVEGIPTQFAYPYCDTHNNNKYTDPSLPQNYYGGGDPFSLHWDDITNSDDSISPGLYRRFWKNLHEKVNGGASLRTCLMNLKDADINKMDYRDIIRLKIDGVDTYWTINKIIDFKPGGDTLTKVELVQYDRPPKKLGQDEDYSKRMIGPSKDRDYEKVPTEKGKYVRNSTTKKRKSIKGGSVKYTKGSKNETGLVLRNKTGNYSEGSGIAFGHGVTASNNQTVIGQFNDHNKTDIFQVGSGYIENGRMVKKNSISINKSGEITFYGGEVVGEFTTGDLTMIGEIYYTDKDGKTKKLYI